MELFEQIRREYEHGVGTIRAVAKKLGVHRRMPREALADALPPERKKTLRPEPKLGPLKVKGIYRWHFWKRISEHRGSSGPPRIGFTFGSGRKCQRLQLAESTVRRYVAQKKRAMGVAQDVFVAQWYAYGAEAQVDWFEAYANFMGDRQKVYVFCMRSMATGAGFHCAYLHATQQAFLEAHERAFLWFGGVFQRVRYDNLTSAVKRILRGNQREETIRFIAFRSHWGFVSKSCTPGQEIREGWCGRRGRILPAKSSHSSS